MATVQLTGNDFRDAARGWFRRGRAPVALDRRLDWLETAYKVTLPRGVRRELRTSQKAAQRVGRGVPITLGESGERPATRHALRRGRKAERKADEARARGDIVVKAPPVLTILTGELVARARRRARERYEQTSTSEEKYGGASSSPAPGQVPARLTPCVLTGELAASVRPGEYQIKNRDVLVRVDLNARELQPDGTVGAGWTLVIQWRALTLAEHGPARCAAMGRRIAAAFGSVLDARSRRFDLCATFMHWPIAPTDRDRLVLRSRAKVDDYEAIPVQTPGRRRAKPVAETSVRVTRHGSATVCTGFTVSPGNPIMARIYDKIADLTVKGDARWRDGREPGDPRSLEALSDKGAHELATWRAAGWVEGIPVTRVEFQVRGEALDDFQMRDPATVCGERLDAIWRYCVGEESTGRRKKGEPKKHRGWMRLVIGGRSRMKRAEVDPRWIVAQRVAFVRHVAPATRVRKVGEGATWKQGLGATLSSLAAMGVLPAERIGGELYVNKEGFSVRRKLSPSEYAHLNSPAQAAFLTADHLRRVFDVAWRTYTEALIAERGPQGALEWTLARIGGARARNAQLNFDRARAELVARTAPDAIHPWARAAA